MAFSLDRNSLLAEFSEGMNVRYGRLIREQGLYTQALSLAGDSDRRIAFRASWALEWAFFDDPAALLPHWARFLEGFLNTKNHSVQRSYTKMLLHLVERGIYTPSPEEAERILTAGFDRIIDPDTPIAVQVFSLDLVSRLASPSGWVTEELREILLRLSSEGSPGQRSRSLKILRRQKERTPR